MDTATVDTGSGEVQPAEGSPASEARPDDGERKRRRRGKRGGRRRRRHEDGAPNQAEGGQANTQWSDASGQDSPMTESQPDWQSPDDGVPAAPREQPESAAPAPAPYEQPERRGNGSSDDRRAIEAAVSHEPSHPKPEQPAQTTPAEPEVARPKRKGWWQRLTQ
jgi:ribonuclease E